MIRSLICLSLSVCISTTELGMLRACRQNTRRQARATSLSYRITTFAAKKKATIRNYSAEHDENFEAKRQATWLRMQMDLTERVDELKAKGAKHRVQATQHTNYAKAYETLAELEKDKFKLFQITLEKLNEAARYGEEPNLEDETKLLQVLHETYAEFYDALPNEDKQFDDKF